MERLLVGAMAAALAFWAGGCSRSGPRLRPLPPQGRVLAFGDSITHGTGAGPGEDYPSRLAAFIHREVINAGVPGEETAQGLKRLPGLLERFRPALVIICEGGNDILRGRSPGEIEANLRGMVDMVKERGADVVLVAVPHFSWGLRDLPLYRRIGEQEQVVVFQGVLAHILSTPSLKADMVHPNGEGYRLLARELARLLRRRGALPGDQAGGGG